MATSIRVSGNIAEPQLRHTQQGKAVLELRIAGTFARKDQQTHRWEDVGEQLWLSASFWEQEAERLYEALNKGSRVTVEGQLVIEAYESREGIRREKLVIYYPRFLGVIPRRNRQNDHLTPQPDASSSAPVSTTGPTGNGTQTDPWAAPGQANFDDEPPF